MKGIPEEVRHSASELVLCCVSSLDRSVALPALMASSYCTSQRARSQWKGTRGNPLFLFFFSPLLFSDQLFSNAVRVFA